MRWEKLFDDLESQLERELTAEELDLDAEEERLRLGRLSVRDRLLGIHESGGGDVVVTLAGGLRMTLAPVTFGRDWFSAEVVDDARSRRQCIIPIDGIVALSIAPAQVSASLSSVVSDGHPSLSARLGLAFVLRDLCRRRRPVDLVLEATSLHGTIDRVGRDHLDLAIHEPGTPRRESAVAEVRIVPLVSIGLVRL